MQNIASTVSIPGESLCPCGSGKSLSECCISKNHIYESLSLDETGATIIYDQSEIISAVKNLNSFIEARINTTDKIAQSDALRKLKRLYEKFGTALEPMSRFASCKAGCGHCCQLLVLTSKLEADAMKEYIASHFTALQIAEFKEKVGKHKEILSSITVNSDGSFSKESTQVYLSSRIPCAFLDENNCCSIYEARPFICRKYIVFNPPEICKDLFKTTSQYYSKYHSTVKDAIIKLNQLTYGRNYEYKHLMSWFI